MMKSRQSAIRLRLSRLARCLLALGCIKLGIIGLAAFELPMPPWRGASETSSQVSQPSHEDIIAALDSQLQAQGMDAPRAEAASEPATGEMPVGAAAAELAAAARPGVRGNVYPTLPAPILGVGSVKSLASDGSNYLTGHFPEPPSLGAPLASAGVVMPDSVGKPVESREDSIWDLLDVKSLPIPGLGASRAAYAAALDMPIPKIQQDGQRPLAPAEQVAPMGSQPTVLPGAPPLPANLSGGAQPPVPSAPAYAPPHEAPAPTIGQHTSSLDPNMKNQELARQQQDILMLRQQMDQRMKELQTAEDKMKDMIRDAKALEDSKVKNLVQMYANMKPRMAAQALENMDERIAVRILAGMAPKQSGEILTYTDPAKTAKFTEMMTRLRMAE